MPPPDPADPALRALIEKWREKADKIVAMNKGRHDGSSNALNACADDLAALLAAPRPQLQEQEEKDDTRVDDSQYAARHRTAPTD